MLTLPMTFSASGLYLSFPEPTGGLLVMALVLMLVAIGRKSINPCL